jgi:antitoxin FitA
MQALLTMRSMSPTRNRFLASLTIRNLEPALKERLRIRAAHQGRSMEAEARAILESALAGGRSERSLFERIHGRFAAIGGVELELPPRDAGRPPPEFD